jgi:hypothetical protein
MRVDFPDPLTPGDGDEGAEGDRHVHAAQVVLAGAVDADRALLVERAPLGGDADLLLAAQVLAGDRGAVRGDFVDGAGGDHLAAVLARARAHVDEVVGHAHRLLVVLDDDDGVAEVAELREGGEEARVVALVQADRGLVEDVEHPDQPRADLRREPDALRLAARERLRRPVEREVVESHVLEEAQALAALLEDRARDLRVDAGAAGAAHRHRLEEGERVAHRERHHGADVVPVERDRQRLGLEPRAVTGRTGGRHHVALELHAYALRLGLVEPALHVRQDPLPLQGRRRGGGRGLLRPQRVPRSSPPERRARRARRAAARRRRRSHAAAAAAPAPGSRATAC